jgi:murein DD-endopeptidase MepM/ murein hydrolase activator NlpD
MWSQSSDYNRLVSEMDTLQKDGEGMGILARQLTDRIAELQISAEKLRIAAGLDEESLGGSGGPRSKIDPVLSLSPGDLSRHFRNLDRTRITLQTEMRQLSDYYTTREILIASTPSIMPTKGYPSDRFGRRDDPFNGVSDYHPGIDISAPRGAKVVATADGLVVFASRRFDYGNLVTIEHKFGVATRYGHLQSFAVKVGDRVKRGDIIGYVGSTGRSTGPHLHYEVRLRNQPLNPLRFLHDSQ